MAFKTSNDFDSIAEINITPLVDVMLVLLIIFMVTAPMLVQGLQVELPRESTGQLKPTAREPVILTLTRQRAILVGERAVPTKNLAASLGPLLSGGPRPVYLKADREVPYGFIVQILAELNRMGVEEIGMVTAPPEPR
jgi:biopolymer transport protein TolR